MKHFAPLSFVERANPLPSCSHCECTVRWTMKLGVIRYFCILTFINFDRLKNLCFHGFYSFQYGMKIHLQSICCLVWDLIQRVRLAISYICVIINNPMPLRQLAPRRNKLYQSTLVSRINLLLVLVLLLIMKIQNIQRNL